MVSNDFLYQIREKDKSVLLLRNKEDFFGFEHVRPTVFSKELIDLKDEIFNEKEMYDYLEFDKGFVNSWYLKRNAKKWDELGINLQKIQYINPKYILKNENFYTSTINDIYKMLEDGYPTDIPIKIVDDFHDTKTDSYYLEFLKHNSIIIKKINLPKVDRNICNCIYAHEITHIELENAGGGINKITNGETLPIFIELLFANKINDDIENKILNHRLIYIAATINKLLYEKEINFKKRIKLETYLISIIQGIDLFNKYKDGTENTKHNIIEYINNIFLGEKTVEDMLDKYDSNYLSVEPKLKVLKRK